MDTYKIKGEDHYQCREVKAERDALRAERDALKADAERYQWLLKNMTYCASDRSPTLAAFAKRIWYYATDNTDNGDLSDSIDAARGE